MQALFQVSQCTGETDTTTGTGMVRKYYIAAELVAWNYAPSGIDTLTHKPLTENGRYGFTFIKMSRVAFLYILELEFNKATWLISVKQIPNNSKSRKADHFKVVSKIV